MMVVVLIGFIGLAIDGGRLYWERRILQNSVDAGALAASDNYQDSQSISSSLQAAAKEYGYNEKLTGTASANPSWTSTTTDITWSGSSDDLHVVFSSAGRLSTFAMSSSHTVRLAFMVVLGAGSTAKVTAYATGRARTGGTDSDALVTLSTQKCTGGSSPSLATGGTNSVIQVFGGNVQTNGSVTNAGTVNISGGTFSDNCTSPVPSGVTASGGLFPNTAPVSDPGFTAGNVAYYPSAQSAGTSLTLLPGVYAADPSVGGASCYFLSPGIYQLNAGMNNISGAVLSNELRPPDEPNWNGSAADYTTVSATQFWGATGCSGSFAVAAVTTGLALNAGYWGVVVTSTRTDYYPPQSSGGTAYPRESFPSACHAVQTGALQGVQVTVNNVPGATGYNVYAAYSPTSLAAACVGPWGYVGSINNTVTETTTSRGSVSGVFDGTTVTLPLSPANVGAACTLGTYAVGCAAATGSAATNPPGHGAETAPQAAGLYAWDPGRDVYSNGGGDRANSYDCQPRWTDPAAPCAGAYVTPGAVQFVFSNTSCLTIGGTGGIYAFSGYQYQWIELFAPVANICNPTVAGNGGLRLQGAIYWPGGSMKVSGNGGAPIASQVLTNTFTAQGNGSLSINFDFQATPVQGYSQLSQ